ncbi:hypothetical protein Tco_1398176 [Tanacetum coccineum]
MWSPTSNKQIGDGTKAFEDEILKIRIIGFCSFASENGDDGTTDFHYSVRVSAKKVVIRNASCGKCRRSNQKKRAARLEKRSMIWCTLCKESMIIEKLAGVKTVAQEGYPEAELSDSP